MDITSSLRKIAVTIRDIIQEEDRPILYETVFSEFEECEFIIEEVMGLDPLLDEVLNDMYPELFVDDDEDSEEDDGDGLNEVDVFNSFDDDMNYNDED